MAHAHSRNARGDRHDLVQHLRAVAQLAADFAVALGASECGRRIGLWHDIGKFATSFQSYLLACEADPNGPHRGPDHKAAGTGVAVQHVGPLALAVQGHHGGLRSMTELKGWLKEHGAAPAVAEATELARRALPDLEPTAQVPLPRHVDAGALPAELFVRLLFSALVDADYLDTEAHFDPTSSTRRRRDISIGTLWERFERNQRERFDTATGAVAQARREIYQACLSAAEQPPGLFRLAVPTGGGKTLSAMGFALRHALRHDLRRVVVAVPFISITEQTADAYRGILGEADGPDSVVLEHHSGAEYDDQSGDAHPQRVWARLAAENWDAPIVVTTTVQLFESLFAHRTSRCRKLHRLARSVVVLDEAQALPSHLLGPILDGLRQLCAHYGATVVISTATQPAFEAIPEFAALPGTEIVPDHARYFRALERVTYDWRIEPALSWSDIAELLRPEPRALAVLNTKRDALALLDALNDAAALHLSTALCGAHRRAVISAVRQRLADRQPCRLVSTQVIEAGVDLDFPFALRALGPFDAVIQTAGRCNREGRLDRGRVVVVRPVEGGMPSYPYAAAAGITRALLGSGDADPNDPADARTYFRRLFQTVATDRDDVQGARARFDFPEVARRFRMIEDETESVVVPYGSTDERRTQADVIAALRAGAPDARRRLRRLQPYLVSVRAREAEKYRRRGLIQPVMPGLGQWLGGYDPIRGLTVEELVP